MALICDQTNYYDYYYMARKVQAPNSFQLSWNTLGIKKLYVFLAIVILMGTVKKSSIKKYWTTDPLIITPSFGKLMPRNRFTKIMGNLHFINSLQNHLRNQDLPRGERDSMERIWLIFQYLQLKFSSTFRPYQKLIINESLILRRGEHLHQTVYPQQMPLLWAQDLRDVRLQDRIHTRAPPIYGEKN